MRGRERERERLVLVETGNKFPLGVVRGGGGFSLRGLSYGEAPWGTKESD